MAFPFPEDIAIANQALAACGARSTIQSFTDNSIQAQRINLLYQPTRDALLRGAHWNFARATAALTLWKAAPGTPENTNPGDGTWNSAYPPPPWLYSYTYPSDCLLVRYLIPSSVPGGSIGGIPIFSAPSYLQVPTGGTIPHRFAVATDLDTNTPPNELSVVLSNLENALAVYTRQVTNPGVWDSRFVQAMVAALAAQLAIPLSGDKALRKDQVQIAMSALQEARISDGNEGLTVIDHVPDWIRTRGFAGDWPLGSYFTMAWSTPAFLAI